MRLHVLLLLALCTAATEARIGQHVKHGGTSDHPSVIQDIFIVVALVVGVVAACGCCVCLVAALCGKVGSGARELAEEQRLAAVYREEHPRQSFVWDNEKEARLAAQEHGWAAFSFMYRPIPAKIGRWTTKAVSSVPPDLRWTLVSTGRGSETALLQDVRFNPGAEVGHQQTVQCLLPLPGPFPIFPQDAYFEVVVIGGGPLARAGPSDDGSCISVGLASAPHPSFIFPGWEKMSIAYTSEDGRLHCDDAEFGVSFGPPWGAPGDVVGCGFDIDTSSIFFTVNGMAVEPQTESAQYKLTELWKTGEALFPTLGASCDVLLRVNFGQADFLYPPANEGRYTHFQGVDATPLEVEVPGPTTAMPTGVRRFVDSTFKSGYQRLDVEADPQSTVEAVPVPRGPDSVQWSTQGRGGEGSAEVELQKRERETLPGPAPPPYSQIGAM